MLQRRLRTNWPHWLFKSAHYDDRVEESKEARAHRERKERRAAHRAARIAARPSRFARALAGEHTRVTKAA